GGALTTTLRAARISSSASLVLAVMLALALFALGTFVPNEAIRAIAILVTILAPGSAAIAAWIVLASYLAARGQLAATARVNFAVLGLSLLLYLWLIPAFGLVGGAVATTLSYVVSATLGYRESVRSTMDSSRT
ncbi:MAG: polysaccharide biosynthesis C-terminal domain-containing protein, partial [Candidatus Limnocylindria bacterium]